MATPPPYAKMCAYPVRRIYKRGKKKKNSSDPDSKGFDYEPFGSFFDSEGRLLL